MVKVRVDVVASYRRYRSSIGFTIIRSFSKTRTSLMYPMKTSCTQVAGALAMDAFEADRSAVT